MSTSSVLVSLNGAGLDPEGSELEYSWSQVSGDLVDFSSTDSDINFEVNNPFGNEVKVYVFELTVSDTYLTGNPTQNASRSSTD